MVGVLIATHGNLGIATLNTIELIAGPQKNVKVLGLYHEDDPELFGDKILDGIKELKEGGCSDVLIILDFYGGTPCNQTIKLMKDQKLWAITGVNLPMLLEILLSDRDMLSPEELINLGIKKGRKGILNLTQKVEDLMGGKVIQK